MPSIQLKFSLKDRSNYWSSKSENLKQFDAQLLSGFQLATQSGPLCEEPMSGVGIRLLEWDLYNDQEGICSVNLHFFFHLSIEF